MAHGFTDNKEKSDLDTFVDNKISGLTAQITALQNMVNDYWKKIYPVGAIYTSISGTNPASLFGGTWVQFGAGRALVGVDTAQTEFDAVNKTGGVKSITYKPSGTIGNHTLGLSEIPDHTHWENADTVNVASGDDYSVFRFNIGGQLYTKGIRASSGSIFGQPHNHTFDGTTLNWTNMPPYTTVYFWRRTA